MVFPLYRFPRCFPMFSADTETPTIRGFDMWQDNHGSSFSRYGMLALCVAFGSACETQRPCHVDYDVTDTWPGGFIANVEIHNEGDRDLDLENGWNLAFEVPDQQEIVELWDGITQEDVWGFRVNNEEWNRVIPAGGSVSFGFQAGFAGNPPAVPTAFRLNGKACSANTAPDAGAEDESTTPPVSDSDSVPANDPTNTPQPTPTAAPTPTPAGPEPTPLPTNVPPEQTDEHDGHEGHDDGTHDHMPPPPTSGNYMDITVWGTFHGSNHNSEHDELVGGRTAITTEAHEAYNDLRAFLGLPAVTIEDVGAWAFAESLTNNSQAWGNDLLGVGLWYAMQGAKVGWIADEKYDPQILADIQRTARTVTDETAMRNQVMDMVRQHSHAGYADYLEQYGIVDTFINTLKMEPHYGGWMHGRTHGFRSLEGVAINHDVNHLTVLGWDQMEPFMNDTFDWPQWPALDVSDSGVIEYFQSMVSLGNPVGFNLENPSTPLTRRQGIWPDQEHILTEGDFDPPL